MSVLKPGYLDPLFFDPRGQFMLVTGIGLLLAGMFIMRLMIRSSLRE